MTFMRKIMDILNMDSKSDLQCDYTLNDYDSLNEIYNGTLKKRKEEIAARDILSTLGFCSSKSLCKAAKDYLSKNCTRIETCVYAANLCINPTNNNELYLVSGGYRWAGAKYRAEAIFWLKEYIKCGAVSDYVCSYEFTDSNGITYDQRNRHRAISRIDLASLYAKEYLFQDAINELYLSLEIDPYMTAAYATIPMYYIKANDYDGAFDFLRSTQETMYYKKYLIIRDAVDTSIKNTQEKQDSEYVYKPRKRIDNR